MMEKDNVHLQGVGVSGGTGIGKAVLLHEQRFVIPESAADPKRELHRFYKSVDAFTGEMHEAARHIAQRVGKKEGDILHAQITLIRDPELEREIKAEINNGASAELALSRVCDSYTALFSAMEDELLQGRGADFSNIKNRMLAILTGAPVQDLSALEENSILVAEDISPGLTATINLGHIAGIATSAGTRLSHISIIARALGIPAAVAVKGLPGALAQGDTVIVDGDTGTVLCRPDEAAFSSVLEKQKQFISWGEASCYRERPTATADGYPLVLGVNVGMAAELEAAGASGADGIGLLRTEFLYMARTALPDEEEQLRAYTQVAAAFRGRPVVIRTLDVGGDKYIPYLHLPVEANPFLGQRGIRYCLAHPALLKTQFRALLRAAAGGDIRAMLPMVADTGELRQAKALRDACIEELAREGLAHNPRMPLGIMVETPAAALCAEALAKESDFFSIGTNDLTQYTLAADRNNEWVAQLYDSLHPSVLRLLLHTCRCGQEAGIPVAVCGEDAADPMLLPFLIGAGIHEASVPPSLVPKVRQYISGINRARWQEHCPALAGLESAAQVRGQIKHLLAPK